MAKHKNMLKSVEVTEAGKKRKCYHNKTHQIEKGDLVLEVKDGMYSSSAYCAICAKEMISLTMENLTSIKSKLP